MNKFRGVWALRLGIALVLSLPAAGTPRQKEKKAVNVLYAGSLTSVMEKNIGPAFSSQTGYGYQGEGQGSTGAANMIRDHLRNPDVFISADAAINTKYLMGPANHSLVTWFLTFASGALVLGYNPRSRFANYFEEAQAGHRAWYDVLAMPGVLFGRTDPDLDPKGYRTLFLFSLAQNYYHKPGILALLGGPHNPTQIFPEPDLLGRLETGQIDAAIFYKHEVIAHGLPYITLPPEVNQSDPQMAALYSKQIYMTAKRVVVRGSPILFTVSILEAAPNPDGAETFVQFLLSTTGRTVLRNAGFVNVPVKAGGEMSKIPAPLRKLVDGPYTP